MTHGTRDRLRIGRIMARAIAEIEKLDTARDRAFAALEPTRITCETCGHPHWPDNTPEWAAWCAANDAFIDALCSAVVEDRLPFNTSITHFGISRDQLMHAIVRYRAELNRAAVVRDDGTS